METGKNRSVKVKNFEDETACSETPISAKKILDPVSSGNSDSEMALADIVARKIVPELLTRNKNLLTTQSDESTHPTEADISKLSALILGPDNSDALEFINSLRDQGLTLDNLYLELLEPTARHLGELWVVDKLDFFAVTLGVGRLKRIVHHFADLDKLKTYDQKRRALVLVPPGEDHTFGAQIVQRFLRAAGWSVLTLDGSESARAADLVSREWIAIAGLSIGADVQIEALRGFIKSIRTRSLNPDIGIIIGGPIVATQPELVSKIGADGTAQNAPAAVVLAETILAQAIETASLANG
jgi:methanogenic corrinoid protein MtbC1